MENCLIFTTSSYTPYPMWQSYHLYRFCFSYQSGWFTWLPRRNNGQAQIQAMLRRRQREAARRQRDGSDDSEDERVSKFREWLEWRGRGNEVLEGREMDQMTVRMRE